MKDFFYVPNNLNLEEKLMNMGTGYSLSLIY